MWRHTGFTRKGWSKSFRFKKKFRKSSSRLYVFCEFKIIGIKCYLYTEWKEITCTSYWNVKCCLNIQGKKGFRNWDVRLTPLTMTSFSRCWMRKSNQNFGSVVAARANPLGKRCTGVTWRSGCTGIVWSLHDILDAIIFGSLDCHLATCLLKIHTHVKY